MAVQPETITVQSEGLTVSRIVWQRFHAPKPGLVERILDINPGLAALGFFLPVGTVFLLPVDPEETKVQSETVISLWD